MHGIPIDLTDAVIAGYVSGNLAIALDGVDTAIDALPDTLDGTRQAGAIMNGHVSFLRYPGDRFPVRRVDAVVIGGA